MLNQDEIFYISEDISEEEKKKEMEKNGGACVGRRLVAQIKCGGVIYFDPKAKGAAKLFKDKYSAAVANGLSLKNFLCLLRSTPSYSKNMWFYKLEDVEVMTDEPTGLAPATSEVQFHDKLYPAALSGSAGSGSER